MAVADGRAIHFREGQRPGILLPEPRGLPPSFRHFQRGASPFDFSPLPSPVGPPAGVGVRGVTGAERRRWEVRKSPVLTSRFHGDCTSRGRARGNFLARPWRSRPVENAALISISRRHSGPFARAWKARGWPMDSAARNPQATAQELPQASHTLGLRLEIAPRFPQPCLSKGVSSRVSRKGKAALAGGGSEGLRERGG